MPYKKVNSVCCTRCGEEFSIDRYPNPRQKLSSHLRSVISCDQKQKRKELEDFKRSVTSDDIHEFKRLKTQESESSTLLRKMDEMKSEIGALREENREKQILQLTIINLSPKILSYQSTLNPIQELDNVDLSEERFREINALKYPYPDFGFDNFQNASLYQKKIKMLQSILPISIKDENGKVFYLDKDVLKLDYNETVSKWILKALRMYDNEANTTYHKVIDKKPEEMGFRRALLKCISDIHPVID